MGLADILGQIAQGYHEHELMKALGPDYRQRRAAAEAQLAGTGVENQIAQNKLQGLNETSQAEQDLASAQFPGADATGALRQYKVGRLGHQQATEDALNQALIAQHIAPLVNAEKSPKGHYDPERGLMVDETAGTASPVLVDGKPIGAKPHQTPLQLVDMQDPNNPMRVIRQFVPKVAGQSYSKGVSSTLMDRVAQAGTVHDQADVVLNRLQSPTLTAKLGPAMGRYGKLELAIGDADPELAGFAADLASLKAAMPYLHRFRGGPQVIAHFDSALGGLERNPAAAAAAIQSIKAFARSAAINDLGGGGLVGDLGPLAGGGNADPVSSAPAGAAPRPIPAPSGGHAYYDPVSGAIKYR